MIKSYLIQRLKIPDPTIWGKMKAAIAFGGGLKNGGLSDEAIKLIRKIWSFDYMGAAEFEFGVIPKTLRSIANCQKNLICNSFITHYNYHSYQWEGESKEYNGNGRIYYICQKDHEKDVKKNLSFWASNGHHNTKEVILLSKSMSGCKEKYEDPVVGWLELDNGFMFFTNETMWRDTCNLFGIKTPSKKKVRRQK